jgi:hypothetical protein
VAASAAFGPLEIDRATALRRTAVARGPASSPPEMVINGQFFPRTDPPPAEIENVVANLARLDVGVAPVVDSLGAASAHRAVDSPIAVEAEIIDSPPASGCAASPIALPPLAGADSFPYVFDNLAVGRNRLQCEDPETMDRRTPHAETKRARSINNLMIFLLSASHSVTRPRFAAHEYNGRECG